jgi:hypothetical protein
LIRAGGSSFGTAMPPHYRHVVEAMWHGELGLVPTTSRQLIVAAALFVTACSANTTATSTSSTTTVSTTPPRPCGAVIQCLNNSQCMQCLTSVTSAAGVHTFAQWHALSFPAKKVHTFSFKLSLRCHALHADTTREGLFKGPLGHTCTARCPPCPPVNAVTSSPSDSSCLDGPQLFWDTPVAGCPTAACPT